MFQNNKLILLTFMSVMSLSYAVEVPPSPAAPPSSPPSTSQFPPPSVSPSPPIPNTPPPSLPPSPDDGIYYVYAIDVIVPIMFISGILLAVYFFICKKREQPNPVVQNVEMPTVYNTIPPLGTQPTSSVTIVQPDANGISQPITPRTPLTQSTTRVVNLADMQTIDTRNTDNPFMTAV